jgi:hypothetical protein
MLNLPGVPLRFTSGFMLPPAFAGLDITYALCVKNMGNDKIINLSYSLNLAEYLTGALDTHNAVEIMLDRFEKQGERNGSSLTGPIVVAAGHGAANVGRCRRWMV